MLKQNDIHESFRKKKKILNHVLQKKKKKKDILLAFLIYTNKDSTVI